MDTMASRDAKRHCKVTHQFPHRYKCKILYVLVVPKTMIGDCFWVCCGLEILFDTVNCGLFYLVLLDQEDLVPSVWATMARVMHHQQLWLYLYPPHCYSRGNSSALALSLPSWCYVVCLPRVPRNYGSPHSRQDLVNYCDSNQPVHLSTYYYCHYSAQVRGSHANTTLPSAYSIVGLQVSFIPITTTLCMDLAALPLMMTFSTGSPDGSTPTTS